MNEFYLDPHNCIQQQFRSGCDQIVSQHFTKVYPPNTFFTTRKVPLQKKSDYNDVPVNINLDRHLWDVYGHKARDGFPKGCILLRLNVLAHQADYF